MLENKIKSLIEVIESNNKLLAILNEKLDKKHATESEKNEVKKALEVKESTPTKQSNITVEQVKELAKKVMTEGVERSVIKNIIVGMGAESIADLSDDNLEVLHRSLMTLKGE